MHKGEMSWPLSLFHCSVTISKAITLNWFIAQATLLTFSDDKLTKSYGFNS